MRKYIIGFCAALLLIGTVAFMGSQPNGILITGGFGGEPKLQASQPDQTADWILFTSNGVSLFELPSSGIVPIAYGGTGTNTAKGAFTTLGFGTTVSVSMTNASNVFTGTFNGLDSGITNSSGYTTDTRATNAATALAGNLGNTTVATMTNSANAITGTFTGLGSSLTNSLGQGFEGTNYGRTDVAVMTNTANQFTGAYTGNGNGLTNVGSIYTSASNPTNQYIAGTLYTNTASSRALLIGSMVVGSTSSGAIYWTNGATAGYIPLASTTGATFPFTIPLSTNATFKITVTGGSVITNVMLWVL